MVERFLKFIPSKEAMFLVTHKNLAYQNAFRLLTIVAERARRYNGHPDGLMIGQCHLGKWTDYGMSEQNYKTAKKILERMQLIKIIETNRTRKKVTTGVTTEGTLIELISSTVYDINIEDGNDRSNDCLTTAQRLPNDKLRKNKKDKKEKEEELPLTPSVSKIKFREFVELTQDQHDVLLAKHGPELLKLMFDKLDSFKGSNGKSYKSDYHTMKDGGWVLIQVKKDLETQKSKAGPSSDNIAKAEMLCNEFSEYKNGRGWRFRPHTDTKKDQRGFLFENESPYLETFFVALSDLEFQRKCEDFIKTKNMRQK
jgi:hypothetical protein